MLILKMLKKIKRMHIILLVFIVLSIYTTLFPIPIFQKFDQYFSEIIIYNNEVSQDQEELVVVLVGDKTINALKSWPIDRKYYANLIENHMADSKVIIMDFLFPDVSTQEGDMDFAKVMARNGKVVLPYLDNYDGQTLTFPIDLFLNTANSIGYINYVKDDDDFVRNYTLFNKSAGILRKSLLFSALEISGYDIVTTDDSFTISKKVSGQSVLTFESEYSDFFVVPSSDANIKVYELIDVLENKYSEDEFEDKIVFIGGSFAGASDTINMPIKPVIGVHFLLNALNTLFADVQPTILPVLIQIILKILNIFIVYIAVKKLKLIWSVIIPIFLVGINSLLFIYMTQSLWITFDIAHFLLMIIIAFIISLIDKILFGDDKLKKMEESLDEILNLNIDTIKTSNFVDYVKSIEQKIINQNNFFISEYLINHSNPIIHENYSDESTLNIRILKDRVIIPLNSFNKKIEIEFIVLGYTKKVNLSQLKYIASLLVSSYIYFQYSSEFKKKNLLFMNLFQSMISAVDAKSPITSFHSKRVAEFSVRVGTLLGYDDEALEKLHFAGIIHDIGKIGVPDNVLDKPCFFSTKDREIMQSHPTQGVSIIHSIDLDDDIKSGVLQHHERTDGKGYPLGIKGDQISEVAHIIKIADVYDALISERQYKKAWPLERVCNLIYEGLGTDFDERIGRIALEDIKPEGWIPPVKREWQKKTVNGYVKGKLLEIINKSRELYDHQIKDHMLYIEQLNEIGSKSEYQLLKPSRVDFAFDKSFSFGTIDFGEHLSKKEWLNSFPICILAEEDKERLYYYKHNEGLVKGFIYIFLRGYLNVCVLNSGSGVSKDDFVKKFEIYGEPTLIEDAIQIWDLGAICICLQNSDELDFAVAMYYNKYFLEG